MHNNTALRAVGIPTLYVPSLYHLNLHFKSSPSGGESHHSGREARGSPPGSTHLVISEVPRQGSPPGSTHLVISGVPRRGSPPGSTHLIILGYPYNYQGFSQVPLTSTDTNISALNSRRIRIRIPRILDGYGYGHYPDTGMLHGYEYWIVSG